MPTFELLLEGPAVSLRAAKKHATRYQAWIRKVRTAAENAWPSAISPVLGDVTVTITNIFTEEPPDVDNIVKPILDALCKVAYVDDRQVIRVISQKFDMTYAIKIDEHTHNVILVSSQTSDQEGAIKIDPITSLLAEGLARYSELIHVEVVWDRKE